MTINEALQKGIDILKLANKDAPALEAGVILCYVLECDKAFLYSHYDSILENSTKDRYFELVEKRLRGVPLQYITGHQEFMSLDFIVNPSVLIPRHDTEVLVEAVINYSQGKGALSILDIGTGSGCISVSLAHYIKACQITTVDISEEALSVARLNAVKAGVKEKIEFVHSNLFENLSTNNKFDIIVSNPPYIPSLEIKKLQVEVRHHEPLMALDGGIDGLDFYRDIIEKSVYYLKPSGMLVFEVGFDQAAKVAELMERKYHNMDFYKDLSGIDRTVRGILK